MICIAKGLSYHFQTCHLFHYFQIRHFLQNQFPEFPNHPTYSEIDSILSLKLIVQILISIIHTEIDSIKPGTLNNLKVAWEQDLGVEQPGTMWETVLGLVQTSSICARQS